MIGRETEQQILKDCMNADRSRLVVVYGRRRVGKTYLILESFNREFTFMHTGVEEGTFGEQLSAFWSSLKDQWKDDCPRPKNWMEAFDLLKKVVKESSAPRKTIFIDELPWMDTRRSNFVKAVSTFWNGWASARTDVVMIVCGSAASWISNKVLQSRGGLFNRANHTLYLEPFTLSECEQYLQVEKAPMNRKDIVSIYMALGGAPYYWSLLDGNASLEQNFDCLFFKPNAVLSKEFKRLYRSVFTNPEPYISVVTALGTRKIGMTRGELVRAVHGLNNDGKLTALLDNLEVSGFIRSYAETGKRRKETVYQLIDNFTLFYFKFLRDYKGRDPAYWTHMVNNPSRIAWEGLAFERVCLQHSQQIKKALGISGVATSESAWRSSGGGPESQGAQIDLVIERGDRVTNLCEMKYVGTEYLITADGERNLRNKVLRFQQETKTRHTCQVTFVTTYGVKRNQHSSIVQSQVTMDDLFVKEDMR